MERQAYILLPTMKAVSKSVIFRKSDRKSWGRNFGVKTVYPAYKDTTVIRALQKVFRQLRCF